MLNLAEQRLLILAPHLDDEVLGCGGLIRRVKQAGGQVFVLFITVGTTQDFSQAGVSSADRRRAEMEEAAAYFDYDGYHLAFPGEEHHLRMDAMPRRELVHAIERGSEISLEALRPTMLLIPDAHDYNQDHWAVHEAAIVATRPAAPEYKVCQPHISSYELPYSGWARGGPAPQPSLHIALSDADLDAKLEALSLYRSQLKTECGPLSLHGVRTLAAQRGLQCGVRWAESYHVQRLVVAAA